MQRAITAINKILQKQYTEEEIETFEWYVDVETIQTYSWKFRVPKDGAIWIYVYDKNTRKVTNRRAGR